MIMSVSSKNKALSGIFYSVKPTHLSHSCMAPQPDAQVYFLQILDATVSHTRKLLKPA